MGKNKKRGLILFNSIISVIFLLSIVFSLTIVSAEDVAYVYDKTFAIDNNVIQAFNDKGLSVETIQINSLYQKDLSKYRLIFVGDEKFRNPNLIPVGSYPTIVANYYHGSVWGLTDGDGVSKIAGSKPMSVKKSGALVQVYNSAFFNQGSSVAIPYYYLSKNNKAQGFETYASTYTGNGDVDLGDVISLANESTRLVNGKLTNGKICFYGVVYSDFWTPGAKNLFYDCIGHVTSACFKDSDCGGPVTQAPYCVGDDVYQDQSVPFCENPGSISATCSVNSNPVLIEACSGSCLSGSCVECTEDSQCNDDNSLTQDSCNLNNNTCEYKPINCLNDQQCDDTNNRTIDECVNPGTTTSFCRNTEVNCLVDNDCGFTGFLGSEFCSVNDVYKNYQNASCVNPGTLQSNCVVTQNPKLVNTCNDGNPNTLDTCSNSTGSASCLNTPIGECSVNSDCGSPIGQKICVGNNVVNRTITPSCINGNLCEVQNNDVIVEQCSYQCLSGSCVQPPVACSNNNDCNDNNTQTLDVCNNPGTPQSYCTNTALQCINDGQCGSVTSQLLCNGNNVVNKTITPKCVTNNCDTQINESVVEQCSYQCSNGACVQPQILCSNNSQCNDNNGKTIDECVNPGTPQSYCRNTEVNCLSNNDCGFTGFLGSEFCSVNDVYKNYQNASCVNPGTLQSNCVVTQNPVKTTECDDGNTATTDSCSNAICIHTLPQNNPVCGNGIKESGEQCDDHNTINGDGCSSICTLENGQVCQEICSGGAVNFELVIDRSGSMNRLLEPPQDGIFVKVIKMKGARDAAQNLVIKALNKNPNSKIGVSTFSTDWVNDLSLTSNLQTLNNTLTYLYANGNADTNYNQSIRGAVDKLLAESVAGSPKIIIFLSDGQPTVVNTNDNSGAFVDSIDVQESLAAAQYAKNKGVKIISVGFGKKTDLNETLLKDIAQISGGQYFFVESYPQIIELYGNIGQNTCEIVCTQPTITCHNNTECDDNNAQTSDLCVNPGTQNSYCTNTALQCINDGQCGSVTSNKLCVGSNVVNRTTTPTCVGNNCQPSTNDVVVQQCANGCSNGACVQPPISCSTNSQCNDGNSRTIDECINAGSPQSYCRNTEVNCLSNNDCGFTGFLGSEFCSVNDVYKNYQNSSCVNPGTLQSNCVVTQSPKLVNSCNDGNPQTIDSCSNAICIHGFVTCNTNSDCNDNNQQTNDLCVNPGTTNSYCSNTVLQCINNGQCGSVTSQLLCNGNVVVNKTTTPTCTGNSCTNNVNEVNVQTCSYQCSNGACVNPPIACSNNNDCNDNNNHTQDICVYPGTQNSYCENNQIICFTNSECNDNNAQTSDVCNNPGTPQSYCTNTVLQCINNGQCGSSVSYLTCSGSSVINVTSTPTCVGNSCINQVSNSTVQQCQYGCSSGSCVQPPIACSTNAQCNDNNNHTQDICNNPGTPQSYCSYNQIICFNNAECGDNNPQTSDVCVNPGTTNSYCENNVLQCINNGQCGSVTSQLLCNGNVVVNKTTTPTCVGNSCTNNVNEVNVQTCSYQCSNGACVNPPIACYTDAQCDDANPRTVDQCANAGTPSSYCRNTEVNCLVNLDCGVTGFIGSNFCSINDVYKTYQNSTCVNPGTLESNCVISQTPKLVNDCNDHDSHTADSCVEENNDAYCNHEILECTTNGDCGSITTTLYCDGSNLINQTLTPTCSGNSCSSSVNNTLVEVCAYGCSEGACLPQVECNVNSDCGVDSVSDPYCVEDGVYHNLIEYTCLNPGTQNSYCQTNTTAELVEACSDMCYEGSCVDIACFSDTDCKDSNRLTLDYCRNPGTTQSYCENLPIICKNNRDCDDGNVSTQDICKNPGTLDSFCKYKDVNSCGNNIIENGEECDDGNLANGDGCSESCLVESCVEICQSTPFDFEVQIDRSASTLLPFGYLGYVGPLQAGLLTGPPKILVEKFAAQRFVNSAIASSSKNKVGIGAFSSQYENVRDLSKDAQDLNRGILSIHVFGTTDYYDTIVSGVDKLESQGRKNSQKIIIFISDGHPNGLSGIDRALEAAEYAKAHDVKIYTIGVDGILHVNAPLLRKMASISDGKYQFASSSVALNEIYRRLGEETCDVICEA